MMNTKIVSRAIPFVGLLLFGLAVWALSRELASYHLYDILNSIREIPSGRVAISFLLTILSYISMTAYDIVGIRYVKHSLAYRRTAFAAFIGYAFSNNIGFGMLASGSIRYRLYSSWGLSAIEIAKIVAFCSIGLWSGFLILCGGIFLTVPPTLPDTLHFTFFSARLFGLVCIGIIITYVAIFLSGKTTWKIGAWELSMPSARLQLTLLGIAVIDWCIAGSALYVLLPGSVSLSWIGFLGYFLLAQTAGIASQIPGGIGVFETVMVLLMSPFVPPATMLGSLLAYRGIYYLIPLFAATLMLGIREILQSKDKIAQLAYGFGHWMSVVVPPVLSITTFATGAMLLFSGAVPAVPQRMHWLNFFLPLPVMELSHFFGSLIGAILILLARSIQRRIDTAYYLTTILLGGGILASLFKGFDYEEALILTGMLVSLFPCRRYFYRQGSLFGDRFRSGWIVAVLIVMACTVVFGAFSHKHIEYKHDLWWHFALSGDAPRFLRAMVGVGGVFLVFMVARLLKPSTPAPESHMDLNMDKVVKVVQGAPATYAYLSLLGDKSFLFNSREDTFIMYGVEGRSWIAMGDPIGPHEEWPELIWRFRELSDRYDGWTVFYEVGRENLHLYLDLGLNLLKLGEEGRVSLSNFSLEGSTRKGLRYTVKHMEREGFRFEILPLTEVAAMMPEFKKISDSWLDTKHTKEKRFSLGRFDENYLKRFPAAVVSKDQTVFAFANIWESGGRAELSIDLMRHLPAAPRSLMEYLTIQLMLWGKQSGYQWFNLGMAPFSGLEEHSLASLWNRMGAFLFRHGEHFYNLQGLRQYKEKFDPVWEPKYLAVPGGFSLPRVLANVTALISDGLKGAIVK